MATDFEWLEIVVEVIDEGNAGWDIEAYDGFIAHLVQVLDDGTQ